MKQGRRVIAALLASVALAASAPAQQPVPSGPAQAAQNPELAELVRQRIQQSGLTPEQIRARLRASGYPESLLDAYLGPADLAQPGAVSASGLEPGALQALGLPPIPLPGEHLPVDTGFIRSRADRGPSDVFGVDVFRRATTQFLPLLSGPMPSDYRIGPGDALVIILTGDVERAYTQQVNREGFILLPQVGQIFVANLTLDQLRDVLYARLSQVYASVRRGPSATTRFDVSIASVRVNHVYVVGEVEQPGAYQISALGSVLTALYAAGGVTERANLRQIEVRRLGKQVATLDLYDYLLRGDPRNDVRLETGDIVFVPLRGKRVQITGAVHRPATYELKPGETLTDLVLAAGGFRANAELRRIAVHRILPAVERGPGPFPRAAVDVPLTIARPTDRLSARASPHDGLGGVVLPAVSLEDGDSVVVDSIPPLDASLYVSIAGVVSKPGIYPWREGMTLRELLLLARGPSVGAYLREAEIARLPEDRERGQLATTLRVPLDSTYLFERDSTGRYIGPPGLPFPAPGAPEVALQPYDNVLILRQPDFDFQRSVVVTGEVRYPGTYSLRSKDERLAEVLERAGGLTQQAYPEGIRFVRLANAAGRINIDLPRALRDRTSRDNVILQPSDSIYIPEYVPSVKVLGAVTSPGSVLWKRGAPLAYYLSAAGGFAANADKKRVSVRFANGEVRTRRRTMFVASDPKPGPGSEVFVPVQDVTQKTNYVALFGVIAQVLSSAITIIVVLAQ